MRVVITKEQLDKHTPCSEAPYLNSPEWDPEQQALVYVDWNQTVQRMLENRKSADYLQWLITHKLVPMTTTEMFIEKIRTRPPVKKGGKPRAKARNQ